MDRLPAATLTDALLARKGTAMPTPFDAHPRRELATRNPDEAPHLALLKRHAAAHDEARPHAPRHSQPAHGGPGGPPSRRRITLRLDTAHHRRLKLAAAHLGTSLQELLIIALDSHLAKVAPGFAKGGCACLGGPVLRPVTEGTEQ